MLGASRVRRRRRCAPSGSGRGDRRRRRSARSRTMQPAAHLAARVDDVRVGDVPSARPSSRRRQGCRRSRRRRRERLRALRAPDPFDVSDERRTRHGAHERRPRVDDGDVSARGQVERRAVERRRARRAAVRRPRSGCGSDAGSGRRAASAKRSRAEARSRSWLVDVRGSSLFTASPKLKKTSLPSRLKAFDDDRREAALAGSSFPAPGPARPATAARRRRRSTTRRLQAPSATRSGTSRSGIPSRSGRGRSPIKHSPRGSPSAGAPKGAT